MANSVKNVLAGRPKTTGGLLRAPIGTALPTDETTELAAAFKPLGYLGDGGFELTPNRSTDKKKAWGGDIVLVLQTEFGVESKFNLLEFLNAEAAKVAFGNDNVAVTPATSSAGEKLAIKVNSVELDHAVYVAEIRHGGKKVRVVIPDGQPTSVDTIPFKDDDGVQYPTTLTCFPDEDGQYAYIYTDNGVTTV